MRDKRLSLPTFWITNISKRNVGLSDLNFTVPAHTSVNLLDAKHHPYTLTQLQQSALSGSLFQKRHLIAIRQVPPTLIRANIPLAQETYIPTRQRSILTIEQEDYEELSLTDEQFANDNADLSELDRAPIVSAVSTKKGTP